MGRRQAVNGLPTRNSNHATQTGHHHLFAFIERRSGNELTVPDEENMAQANLRKKCKYEDLIREGQKSGLQRMYFPVELGARGSFTGQSLRTCFRFLNLINKEIKVALFSVSKLALRATYTLWISRNNNIFGSWELISRPYIHPVEENWMEFPAQPTETERLGINSLCHALNGHCIHFIVFQGACPTLWFPVLETAW